jgi:hypothetical protein
MILNVKIHHLETRVENLMRNPGEIRDHTCETRDHITSLFKELQVLPEGGNSPFASPRELRGAKLRGTLVHFPS